MKTKMNRRMFLRGTGGALMAIPFLPSLTTRAFAQPMPPPAVGRCFMAICTDHGDVWGQNQYPSAALLNAETQYAGRTVRHGRLPTAANAEGNLVWSPAYTAAANRLTPQLAGKFNVLRGLDIPFRIGHHYGGHLGNYAGTVDNTTDGVSNVEYMTATIDQVMAYAESFYTRADLDTRMTQRSFCIASGQYSYNFTSPSTRTGNVVQQPARSQNLELYDVLFQPGSAFNGINGSIVDGIRANFARLRRHPRLSRGDLMRLDQHVERMAEIERKLRVAQVMAEPPARPESDTNRFGSDHTFSHNPVRQAEYCGLMNDIVVAAFSTGTSRVGTWGQRLRFTESTIADWHGNVAHNGMGAEPSQRYTLGWHQGTFEHVMVDLAAKLDDVQTQDGRTLLDHSLITLTSEGGQLTHHAGCVSFPLITAGGAGGYFNTGHFVDFSNQEVVYDDLNERIAGNAMYQAESPGLLYNQWLANALLAMGLSRDEYEGFRTFSPQGIRQGEPVPGFGFQLVDPHRSADYAQARAVAGDPLPVITG